MRPTSLENLDVNLARVIGPAAPWNEDPQTVFIFLVIPRARGLSLFVCPFSHRDPAVLALSLFIPCYLTLLVPLPQSVSLLMAWPHSTIIVSSIVALIHTPFRSNLDTTPSNRDSFNASVGDKTTSPQGMHVPVFVFRHLDATCECRRCLQGSLKGRCYRQCHTSRLDSRVRRSSADRYAGSMKMLGEEGGGEALMDLDVMIYMLKTCFLAVVLPSDHVAVRENASIATEQMFHPVGWQITKYSLHSWAC